MEIKDIPVLMTMTGGKFVYINPNQDPNQKVEYFSLPPADFLFGLKVEPSVMIPSQESYSPPGTSAGDWPMFGHDIGATRSNLAESIIGPQNVGQLKVKWTFEEADGFSQSTPIVVGDRLYFTAHDGHVHAVDARSGRLEWKFDAWKGIQPDTIPLTQSQYRANMFREMRGSAAYADGRIFVGDATARFHCLDAASGEEVWRTVMDPQAGANQSLISASPIFFGNKIFIGLSTTAGRSHIACLDAGTGAIRWRFDTAPGSPSRGWRSHLDLQCSGPGRRHCVQRHRQPSRAYVRPHVV